jgi:hypothetical protein
MSSKLGTPLRPPRALAFFTRPTTPTRCSMELCSCTRALSPSYSFCCFLLTLTSTVLHFGHTFCMAVADTPIGFVAKATLFNLPIMGTLLRWVGAIPIHRAQDAPAGSSGGPSRASSNKGAFSAISARLRQNGRVAIFPEGISHMESHIMPLYTGITRMALDAVQGADGFCCESIPANFSASFRR